MELEGQARSVASVLTAEAETRPCATGRGHPRGISATGRGVWAPASLKNLAPKNAKPSSIHEWSGFTPSGNMNYIS